MAILGTLTLTNQVVSETAKRFLANETDGEYEGDNHFYGNSLEVKTDFGHVMITLYSTVYITSYSDSSYESAFSLHMVFYEVFWRGPEGNETFCFCTKSGTFVKRCSGDLLSPVFFLDRFTSCFLEKLNSTF
jgi:hypothetical protein